MFLISFVALAVGLGVTGPAAAQTPHKPPQAAPRPVTTAATPAPQVSAEKERDYEIGAEDILRVTVYGHEDLTQTVVIQSDGTFTFPLIGRVKGSEMTPKELERKITTLLAQGYVRSPQVTVVVQEYRSKTVFVVGEIAKPGTYALQGKMTVVEVLSRAGPTTANAGAEVIVVRPLTHVQGPVLPTEVEGSGTAKSSGKDKKDPAPAKKQAEVIRVNIREIQAGDLEKNIVLRPNDTVFVPLAPKVFVSGEVRSPGAYTFTPGTTVRQAISLAGGLTEDGSNRVRVVRTAEGKTKETKIKLDDLVQAGDTVIVKRKLF